MVKKYTRKNIINQRAGKEPRSVKLHFQAKNSKQLFL